MTFASEDLPQPLSPVMAVMAPDCSFGETSKLNGAQGAAIGETIRRARAKFLEHERKHPVCRVCHRALRSSDSRRLGIGPKCAKKVTSRSDGIDRRDVLG